VIPKKTRFEILESLRGKYRLAWLLEIAEVSRAGYYKWRKARERAHGHAQQEYALKEHIMAIHRLRPYYGYLRIDSRSSKGRFSYQSQTCLSFDEGIGNPLCHS
jgi:putative transposase